MNRELKSKIILEFGTQEDFAVAVNERPAYISQIIRNRRDIAQEKKVKWADALNCTIIEIFIDSLIQ